MPGPEEPTKLNPLELGSFSKASESQTRRSASGSRENRKVGRRRGQKIGGPFWAPFFALPPSSGFGAAKPAHPGIRDSRTSELQADCHRAFGHRRYRRRCIRWTYAASERSSPFLGEVKIHFLGDCRVLPTFFGMPFAATVGPIRQKAPRPGRKAALRALLVQISSRLQ